MGVEIENQIPFTKAGAKKTKDLAFKEAERRQQLALKGFFNKSKRTCDVEQEIQVMNKETGLPLNAQSFVTGNKIGARLDTTVFNLEYDGIGITSIDPDGIMALYRSYMLRTENIQKSLKRLNPKTILVPIGLQPIIGNREGRKMIIRDKRKRRRFDILDKRSTEENPRKKVKVSNTSNKITGEASNLFAMARCSGTQIHISETSVDNVIQTHNILIALTPIMVALFGNSIFSEAKDTGRVSTRIEFLRQAEQLRAGLPYPVNSLFDFYASQLNRALPPFMILDDPIKALDLSCGAIHTTSRIQVDLVNGTIRNEIRQIDSQSPFRTISALLFTLGCIEALRNERLPSFRETEFNFTRSVFGLSTKAILFGRKTTLQSIAVELSDKAEIALKKMGLISLVNIFLPTLKEEIITGETQGIKIRKRAKNLVKKGSSLNKAIIVIMNELNQKVLAEENL